MLRLNSLNIERLVLRGLRMKFRFIFMVFGLCLLNTPVVNAKSLDWGLYDALLKDHVASGVRHGTPLMTVDYLAIQKDPRFNQIVTQFEAFDISQLESKEEKLAFFINAYNVLAIKMVLDHWPVKSIRDIGNIFSPVWKKTVGKIANKPVSLDQVEHKILRPMGDPRIHVAIVCASVSCPDLSNTAYTASQLDQQLDTQSVKFLNNPIKGLVLAGDEIRVSKIFDWFEEDFDIYGGVESFLSKYHSDLPKESVVKANLDYDWSLNKP